MVSSTLQPAGQPPHTEGVFWMSHGRAVKRYGMLVSAPTGQMSMMLPVKRPSYWSPVKVAISEPAPRSSMISSLSSATSWLKRTQRQHEMHRSRSRAISDERLSGFGKCRLVSTNRVVAGPNLKVRSWSGHSPPLSHTGQSRGWFSSRNSSTPSCPSLASAELVCTTMSGCTGVLQAVCRPRMPSISTRHMRQAPTGGPRRGS